MASTSACQGSAKSGASSTSSGATAWSGRLKIALPQIEIDAVAAFGVGPEFGGGKGDGIERLGVALAIDIAVRKDMGAMILFNGAPATPRIKGQAGMTRGAVAPGHDGVAHGELRGAVDWP